MDKFICVHIKSCPLLFPGIIGRGRMPAPVKHTLRFSVFIGGEMLMVSVTRGIFHDWGNVRDMRKS